MYPGEQFFGVEVPGDTHSFPISHIMQFAWFVRSWYFPEGQFWGKKLPLVQYDPTGQLILSDNLLIPSVGQ